MKKFPKKLADEILEKIFIFLKDRQIISSDCKILIGMVAVSQTEIKDLNNRYRNKNEATDILSFGYEYTKEKLEGDLILCWEIIQKNAQEDQIEAEQELKKNLIHGCLHLTGREHSEEMFGLQEEFLKL